MNRIGNLATVMLVAFACSLAIVSGTEAGTFTMRQCEGASYNDFQGQYLAVNASQRFDVVNGCGNSAQEKIGVYQDRRGAGISFGEGGQFLWTAPPSVVVIGSSFSARLNDQNGLTAEIVGSNGSTITDMDGGIAHNGEKYPGTWTGPSNPQNLVVARVVCMTTAGCENKVGGAKAFIEVNDVELTARDFSSPTLTASGELWDLAGDSLYHRGSSSITIKANDQGSGVAAAWAEVNGFRVDFPAVSCPGDQGTYATRFSPCPLSYSGARGMNTSLAPFQEGVNLIRLCVRDYADSEADASKTCTAYRALRVDNQPSNPPVDLGSDEGTAWQPENGFMLRWENPEGQVAPVIGAVYRLYDLGTGQLVDSRFFGGSDLREAGPVEVPAVGAYRAAVSLVDGASNLGQPAETILRFDDRPPGDVSPLPASGWISRDELPIEQQVQKAEPGGPSGISGYAMKVSDAGPASPCAGEICLPPELTLSGGADLRTAPIGGLGEGNHWISSTAVSGALRSSLEPGSTMVRVDRTPPSSFIAGVPNGWVNHPVTVSVLATDRLSGMQSLPGDDGNPVTVIDADNYAEYRSPGAAATFSVATEGVNRVSFWAEDLAGNANDGKAGPGGDLHPAPGQAVVRIDMTPPEARFDPALDPQDPELVRVVAEDPDSGVASAAIGIRRAGSGARFVPLPTSGEEGEYFARIPSDDLADGAYELNVTASDRAGNQASGNLANTGQPMIVNLPLKEPSRLSASFDGGGRSMRSRYDLPHFVTGRLSGDDGPLAGQTLRIVETFATGSRRRSTARSVVTDGNGRYRARLGAGVSRSVDVIFDGSRKFARAAAARLHLNVKGKVSFSLKPGKLFNGGTVRMKGSVGLRGALPPANGKLVAVQYFDPSRRKWRPVEVLRTGRRGRFTYTYRFRTVTSPQKFLFRASLLPEAGWPYLPSTSGPRSVIVYPKG